MPTKPRDEDRVEENTREQVTLVRPDAPVRLARRTPSSFPSDLFEQARGRIRLLATFFVIGFLANPLIFTAVVAYIQSVPREAVTSLELHWANKGAAIMSAIVWWAAKSPRVSASRLHTIALIYEVVVCAAVATMGILQFYQEAGVVPPLTWVPAIVIMFPLIVPGPPRRMLVAAIASAATYPLSLLLLDLSGKVDAGDGTVYVPTVVSTLWAIALAYWGARVVYGLGREVAKARAMGSYQLEERLGAGGMGEVWRARHRMLARTAAIKLIRPTLAGNASAGMSDQARQRFEREAQSIARLRSPHTVELFDYGIADDGAFYYAMELLEGLDADALVRRFGPIPSERAVFVLRQVCHSLSEAESCGLVHRDIKPSNVFLCRYGEDYDFVKVLDFGIVKSSHDGPGAQTALTGENVIHGTPAFMAPEQALGSAQIDGRADIYGVGCVAYWLLTAQFVFTADTPTGILMKHIQTPAPAPSSRTELPVPPSMDRIVLACLAKDPGERPQSARELSRLLSEVELARAWTDERGREWWERNKP